MKVLVLLILSSFLFFQTLILAHSQLDWQKKFEADVSYAGVGFLTPDHPFYFLDSFFDRLKILFVLNKQERARKHFLFASERLKEVEFSLKKKDEKSLDLSLKNLFLELEGTKNLLKLEKQKQTETKEFAEFVGTGLGVYQKKISDLEQAAPKVSEAYLTLARLRIEELLEEVQKELPEQK